MEFDNEKKFLRLENNPPPPPITFLMVRRLRYHGDGGRKRHLKSDFAFFKLQRDYHNSLTLSNLGKLSWI